MGAAIDKAKDIAGKSMVAMTPRRETIILIAMSVVVVMTGTIFYILVEGWSWVDALYFCVMTLTTIGYGDVVPVTIAGKLFTIVFALMGIGILFGFVSYIAKAQQHRINEVVEDIIEED